MNCAFGEGSNYAKLSRIRSLVWMAMLCISAPLYSQEKIEFYTTPTIAAQGKSIHAYQVDFADTLAGNTLYQVRAENGYPVSYHRKIRTSVCFDNKCRLLNIIVHWNITGRYLGFELPPGEFLSKAEHKSFTSREYARLHGLLADPNSPLAGFSYNELVPAKAESNPEIDAVSSATAKNLLEFVVEGAAYTTYKLWHIVYGTSKDEVSRLTTDMLTPGLLLTILKSPDISDKIWGLNQRHRMQQTNPEVQSRVLSFIGSDEFSLAARAVHSVGPRDLQDPEFQLLLLRQLDDANYSMKKQVIEKFEEAPELTPQTSLLLAEKLMDVRGGLVGTILDLFTMKNINDIEVCRKVARLLREENVFVSRQAFDFLARLSLKDRKIETEMKAYQERHHP